MKILQWRKKASDRVFADNERLLNEFGEHEATRRNVILRSSSAVAALAAGMVLGQTTSCSATTVLPAVIDAIQKAMSQLCSIVPAVATLIDVIALAFPAAAGVAAITDALAQQIAQYLCALYSSGKEGSLVTATANGKSSSIALHGIKIVNGQMVVF